MIKLSLKSLESVVESTRQRSRGRSKETADRDNLLYDCPSLNIWKEAGTGKAEMMGFHGGQGYRDILEN